jgi:lipopolysaccharide/colanic/teichoic acid biosynthesis glycosyltransferase/protein involved in polysaccharide export with SLBB domain
MNARVIGSYDQLLEIVRRERIDQIVIAMPDRRGKLPVEALLTCKMQGVHVEDGTTFYEKISGKIMLENLRPSWMIFSAGFSVSPLLRLLKRLGDVLLAGLGLVVAAPLLPVIAMLIKIESRGPAFFTQERVGQNGQLFILIKFRSMYVDAEEATGPVYADANDLRITGVGRWLRCMRLDELPQLLVCSGGNGCQAAASSPFCRTVCQRFLLRQRLSVKLGITSWAQVSYPPGQPRGRGRKAAWTCITSNMSLLLIVHHAGPRKSPCSARGEVMGQHESRRPRWEADRSQLKTCCAMETRAAVGPGYGSGWRWPSGACDQDVQLPPLLDEEVQSAVDYRLGAEDVVEVMVWKNADLSREVTVLPDGKISLPLIGDMQAAGLTSHQLVADITAKLEAYYKEPPQVSVIVKQVKDFDIYILGDVATPGKQAVKPGTSFLQAIALAGGFTDFAKTSKIILRRQVVGGNEVAISIDYKSVVAGIERNLRLKPGDTIIVP